MTNYGHDISCTSDLHPGRVASGATLLAEAAFRRLITPRGRLIDDPEYGFDVRGLMSAGLTEADLALLPSRVVAELHKDQRISSVSCVATVSDNTLRLEIAGFGGSSPFKFVLTTDGVTAEFLAVAAVAA